MVGLNPVLRCLMSIEDSLIRGDAVRDAILSWLDGESRKTSQFASSRDQFQMEILEFLRKTEGQNEIGTSFDVSEMRCRTLYRQSLFVVLLDGIRGNSILPRLREVRCEIEAQLELDMKSHVDSLPLKMLVPLLLCMFPAFLILLFGPITQNFVEALK